MKTIFCVQAYRGEPGRLERAQLRQFGTVEEALAGADRIKDRARGYVVYRVSGDPSVDYWEEPEVLVEFGLVPRLAA